jgi:hypothetical protein
MCIYFDKRDPTLADSWKAPFHSTAREVHMAHRKLTLLALVIASLGVAACAEPTAPTSISQEISADDGCRTPIVGGSGTRCE